MSLLTLENLPNAVAEIIKGQSEIIALLLNKAEPESHTESPIEDGIKGVAKLIGKTVPTLYGYCQRNEIPYHKNGNRLIFFKSEIINWIKQGRQKTLTEIEAEADAYFSNKNKGQ